MSGGRTGRPRTRGFLARGAACLVALVLAAGCSPAGADPGLDAPESTTAGEETAGPRPLTTTEAQRLAATRFHNFDAGVRTVTAEYTDTGATLHLDAWVDYTEHVGYGVLSDSADQAVLILWSATGSWTMPWSAAEPAPLPVPEAGATEADWSGQALEPQASRTDALLALLLSLGSDRPDNAVLLAQTDARWLRADQLAGVTVDVIAGPSADEVFVPDGRSGAEIAEAATTRYWVGDDGVLHRFEVRLGGAGDWIPIDYTDTDVAFADDLAFLDGSS